VRAFGSRMTFLLLLLVTFWIAKEIINNLPKPPAPPAIPVPVKRSDAETLYALHRGSYRVRV
jgi:hypothetical protein